MYDDHCHWERGALVDDDTGERTPGWLMAVLLLSVSGIIPGFVIGAVMAL